MARIATSSRCEARWSWRIETAEALAERSTANAANSHTFVSLRTARMYATYWSESGSLVFWLRSLPPLLNARRSGVVLEKAKRHANAANEPRVAGSAA